MKTLPAIIKIAIAGFGVWLAIIIFTWGNGQPNQELLIDLGKSALSFMFATLIAGVVQGIIKDRDDKKQKQKEELTFYQNVLSDFKRVYDKVEKARLLIEAHRTAKTYNEQMQELIGGVVILHNIKRALNLKFPKLGEQLRPSIAAMNNFTKELLAEYRDNYKFISVLQEIDEEGKKALIASQASGLNPQIKREDIPQSAWNKIEVLEKLHILRDDASFKDYEAKFLVHLNEASAVLRTRIMSGIK
ncbi:hypothetical protein [Dyadobacter psychrotolerans]|uniref:Uncharacterized protein n=1 Tax=Dyadobacter psychrotolerans TaxID=2541721 RepID=A0A4R5DK77_9BACT|nr:hypothetical protein [Dyadobacter psychrotolerans]TDE14419.1 hypothetical protein E0F88_14555 [Dyadobacter psychrotolerans]